MYFASGIQHQSESLLYDALLPQLAKPDQEHVALADTLSGAVLALFSFPKAEAEVVYQFEYASRKISYMYDDKRPLPFIAVGLGFSEAQFKEVLASVVPINLQNPQTLALLLHQMSIQFQKRQADSR